MLDWAAYDRFDWEKAEQAAMTPAERKEIEHSTAKLLEWKADGDQPLGQCSPPGRFAATVVRVSPEVEHRFQPDARAQGVDAVGIKWFKTTEDARREGAKVVRFCGERIQRLPGLPNVHVQRPIAAGVLRDGGVSRHYVVQEWVEGETLEYLVRRVWPAAPIDGPTARTVIEQLLGAIVIPLWSAGAVWWDFRDANFCWEEAARKLTMIDVDSLAAYADEIIDTPDDWTRRNKGRLTALSRLKQMTLRILLAQGGLSKAKVERTLSAAWTEELEPALKSLGTETGPPPSEALRRFLVRLASAGLL